jgi:hypothetical protein
MLAATAPFPPARQPALPPSPRERQLTWATIFLLLAAFWSGVAFGIDALWTSFSG